MRKDESARKEKKRKENSEKQTETSSHSRPNNKKQAKSVIIGKRLSEEMIEEYGNKSEPTCTSGHA